MLIIGFGNKARHGKDTAAEAIKNFYDTKNSLLLKHGQDKAVTRIGIFKYATALYQEVNEALSVKIGGKNLWERRYVEYHVPVNPATMSMPKAIRVQLPDWVQPNLNYKASELAPYGKHPKLLQWWGTDFRRTQDPDYWVKRMFESIPSNIDIALVSDVRFQNEADSITERGGYNVNVTRLLPDGTPYRSHDRPADHLSETALDSYPWQFRLSNHEGHQALLEEQAITLAEYLRGLK